MHCPPLNSQPRRCGEERWGSIAFPLCHEKDFEPMAGREGSGKPMVLRLGMTTIQT